MTGHLIHSLYLVFQIRWCIVVLPQSPLSEPTYIAAISMIWRWYENRNIPYCMIVIRRWRSTYVQRFTCIWTVKKARCKHITLHKKGLLHSHTLHIFLHSLNRREHLGMKLKFLFTSHYTYIHASNIYIHKYKLNIYRCGYNSYSNV